MSKRAPSKLSSFFNVESFLEPLTKLEDLVGETLTVMSYETRSGQFGEYVVMSTINDETGMEMKVSSGGMAIKAALKAADGQRAFPFTAKVAKNNRMLIFIDADGNNE